jgi:hypothetical protein
MTDEALSHTLMNLQKDRELANSRHNYAKTDAGKSFIKGLQTSLENIRKSYINIKADKHSSLVMAELASVQGREKEILFQLRIWTGAKDIVKKVDNEITECKKVLVARTAIKQKRRLDNE